MSRYIDADKGLRTRIQIETGCNYVTADRIVEYFPIAEVISLDRIKIESKSFLDWDYDGAQENLLLASETLDIIDDLIAEVEE